MRPLSYLESLLFLFISDHTAFFFKGEGEGGVSNAFSPLLLTPFYAQKKNPQFYRAMTLEPLPALPAFS